MVNSNNFVITHSVYTVLKTNPDGSVRVTKSGISCWRNLDRNTPHLRILDVGTKPVAGRNLVSAWDLLVPSSRVDAAAELAADFIEQLGTMERSEGGAAFKNLTIEIQKLWVDHEEEAKLLAASRKQVKGIPEVIFGVETAKPKPEPKPVVEPEQTLLNDDEIPF